MFHIHRSAARGHFDHGWLKTHHTFSFGHYHNREMMGFRALRVMNEDFVAPNRGFGEHPHHDMEIVTYVISGALAHRDSMGNGETLTPGEFQRMSAGTGITHSEFNPSMTEPVHLYQIWLLPERKGIEPSYEQKRFPDESFQDQFRLVASPLAESGSLKIHQDVRIYLSRLSSGTTISQPLDSARHAWLQVLQGEVTIGDEPLRAGDAAAISEQTALSISATEAAEVLLFDLA